MARRDPTTFLPGFAGAGPAPVEREAERALLDSLARHGGRLRQAALRITRDAAAADDAVQSALEKALRHRASFRGDAQPSTWLHRIVVNEALAWRRSEKRRARHAERAGEASMAGASAPLDALLLREEWRDTLRGLETLRAEDRELLARYALDGHYAAFADATGLRAGAVKTRACRARKALRRLLREPAAARRRAQQQPPSAQGPRVSR